MNSSIDSSSVAPDKALSMEQAIFSNFRSIAPRVREDRELPAGFVPSNYDVICGRGRHAFNHIGNARFRTTVAIYLPKYQAAKTKVGKTAIVTDIVDLVRNCTAAGFVRFDKETNLYTELGDAASKEKVGQSIRDAILKEASSARRKATSKRKLKQPKKVKNKSIHSRSNDSLLSQITYSFHDQIFLTEDVELLADVVISEDDVVDESVTFQAKDFFSSTTYQDANIPADFSAIFEEDNFSDVVSVVSLIDAF